MGSVACCHSNPKLDLPITIGSYPIQDNPYLYQNQTMNDMISIQPTLPQQSEAVGQTDYTELSNERNVPAAVCSNNGKICHFAISQSNCTKIFGNHSSDFRATHVRRSRFTKFAKWF